MKNLFKGVSVLGLGTLAAQAQAAVPEGVTSAITEAGTDAALVGAAVLVVIIGIRAFKYIRKAM